MRFGRTASVCLAFCLVPVCAAAAPPKRVVILAGEALDLPGPSVLVSTIQSTLRKELTYPVDFYIETVDTSRFRSEAYEQRLADLLIEKYGPSPVDLVIAFTEPSVNFLIRHRDRVFPQAPVLLGLVEEGFINGSLPAGESTAVFIGVDARGTVDLALAAYPRARRVLVVCGRSRMDRKWLESVRVQLAALGERVEISYDVDSSVEGVTRRIAELPADSLVLYISMSVDGAGVPMRPRDVLQKLRAAASVPIYGLSSTFLGYGIVGGSVLDFDRHGQDLGRHAARFLSGAHPDPVTTPNLTAVDWREVQRFQLSTADLPPSTRILYRNPSLWEREKRTILLVCAVILGQSALIAALVRTGRRRRETQRALKQSVHLKGAILDSLPAHVAVLDREGTIIAVNDAWMQFGRENGVVDDARIAAGSSYLAACAAAAREGDRSAAEAVALVQAACRGEHSETLVEYQCDSPTEPRWFVMRAEPLKRAEGGAVVTHSDITARKLHEIALRESEGRFRRMADALPVAIWMSEPDTGCSYFNQQWLQMTGRRLEEEVGAGWVDRVHPDDRARCMDAYLGAFHLRQRFHVEYRLLRHDGEYRWLLDVGMPRYGSDGEFHGYVGGCVDITDRRNAEQILRDFSRHLILAQEEERHRIARELHDHLNQQLALLAIDLQQLTAHPPASPTALSSALTDAWQRTTEIASDVHAISHRLHPSKLDALGLVATIRAHCRDVSRQNLAVQFTDENVPAGIPADVALCLFRVVEEALSNVASHSHASEAIVTLVNGDGHLTLRVSDSGYGFIVNGKPSRGLGLTSMRERVSALGGSLMITSAPGKGTVVEARVPLPVPAPAPQEAGTQPAECG